MLSSCFLVGAPFQHGRMRLPEPRWLRALRCWVWIFILQLCFIAFPSYFCEICIPWIVFKEIWFTFMTIYLEYAIKVLFSCYDSFYHVNPWLHSSMLQKSSLPSGKDNVEISHIIDTHSSSCWHYVLIWIQSGLGTKKSSFSWTLFIFCGSLKYEKPSSGFLTNCYH